MRITHLVCVIVMSMNRISRVASIFSTKTHTHNVRSLVVTMARLMANISVDMDPIHIAALKFRLDELSVEEFETFAAFQIHHSVLKMELFFARFLSSIIESEVIRINP